MPEFPLVSVIIPVYKVEPYLDRCVQSIVDQTYTNLEIILVDDGSPDNCPAMCDAWAEKDTRIKVIHKENGGLSDARNAGLAVASGELIGFVDSDDWVLSQFYEVLYNTMTEYNCDLAECDFYETTGPEPAVPSAPAVTVCTTEEALVLHLWKIMFHQVVWNKLYRRDVVTALFEKGKYHEDVFWTYQIIANCKRLVHVALPLLCYFQREDSIMGETYSLTRLDAVEGHAQRSRFLTKRFPTLAGRAQDQLVGICLYHAQKLTANGLDPDGAHRRSLRQIAAQAGPDWKHSTDVSIKKRLWLRLYLIFPGLTCIIRNRLQIGL